MKKISQNEVWFITGSQHLYGEETLAKVAEHAQVIAEELNHTNDISVKILFRPIVKTTEEIFKICQDANQAVDCIGIITWMHTFSPANYSGHYFFDELWSELGSMKSLNIRFCNSNGFFELFADQISGDFDFLRGNQQAFQIYVVVFLSKFLKSFVTVLLNFLQDRLDNLVEFLGFLGRSGQTFFQLFRRRIDQELHMYWIELR